MPDADDNARSERREWIDHAHGAVQFTIDFSCVQNVRTGHIEYGFLAVGIVNGEREQEKKQKLP